MVLLIIPFLLVLLIAYFAISKKSSPLVRKAAIAALFLIGLAVIISSLVIISGPKEAKGFISMAPSTAAPPPESDTLMYALPFLLFFLFFLAGSIFMALRDQKRQGSRQGKSPAGSGEAGPSMMRR